MRMHLVMQGKGCIGFAVNCPGGFVKLLHADSALTLARADTRDLFGKLAHHVAARNPDRQRHTLSCGRLGDGERHTIQMCV